MLAIHFVGRESVEKQYSLPVSIWTNFHVKDRIQNQGQESAHGLVDRRRLEDDAVPESIAWDALEGSESAWLLMATITTMVLYT